MGTRGTGEEVTVRCEESHIVASLSRFYKMNQFCDMVIETQGPDGLVRINIHRVVLACNSLIEDPLSGADCHINVNLDLDPSSHASELPTVIEYLYAKPVLLSPQNVQAIRSIAETLQIESLVRKCSSYINTNPELIDFNQSVNCNMRTRQSPEPLVKSLYLKQPPTNHLDLLKALPGVKAFECSCCFCGQIYENTLAMVTHKAHCTMRNKATRKERKKKPQKHSNEAEQPPGGAANKSSADDDSDYVPKEVKDRKKLKREQNVTKQVENRQSSNIDAQGISITPKNQPFKCPLCSKKLKESLLTSHLQKDHNKEAFSCWRRDCKYMTLSMNDLQHHSHIADGFHCETCDMDLDSLDLHSAKEHFAGVKFVEPKKCPDCNQEFEFKVLYQEHCSRIHGDKNMWYLCDLGSCDYQTVNSEDLNNHQRAEHGTESSIQKNCHNCCLCDFRSKSEQDLFRHLRVKHGIVSKKYRSCSEVGCSYLSMKEADLKKHVKFVHQDQARTACPVCNKSVIDINKHMRRLHQTTSDVPCQFCGKCIKSHRVAVHEKQCKREHDGQQFRCGHCQYKTLNKEYLEGHQLSKHNVVAEGRKVYQCSKCDYKSYRQDNVKNHAVIHSDAKPFLCDVCGKAFSSMKNVKNHKRWHDPKKRIHKCDMCDYKGLTPDLLRTHILVKHKNKAEVTKPYLCSYCPYKSHWRENVRKHAQKQHPDKDAGQIININEIGTDSQRYKCPHCHFRALSSLKVKTHIGKRHRGQRYHAIDTFNKEEMEIHEEEINKQEAVAMETEARKVVTSCESSTINEMDLSLTHNQVNRGLEETLTLNLSQEPVACTMNNDLSRTHNIGLINSLSHGDLSHDVVTANGSLDMAHLHQMGIVDQHQKLGENLIPGHDLAQQTHHQVISQRRISHTPNRGQEVTRLPELNRSHSLDMVHSFDMSHAGHIGRGLTMNVVNRNEPSIMSHHAMRTDTIAPPPSHPLPNYHLPQGGALTTSNLQPPANLSQFHFDPERFFEQSLMQNLSILMPHTMNSTMNNTDGL